MSFPILRRSLQVFSIACLVFLAHAKEEQLILEIEGKQDFQEHVLDSDVPVVVKFYRSDCGACKAIKGTYEDLANKHRSLIKFVAIATPQNPELSKEHNKHGVVPYFQFYDFQNGKLVKMGELVGAPRDPSQLESAILGNLPTIQKKITDRMASTKRKAPEGPEEQLPVAKKQKVEEPAAAPSKPAKPHYDEHGLLEIVGMNHFNDEVINSPIPVVVKFYATWCSPCKMISPAIAELAQRHKGKIKFVSVDIDKNKDVHQTHRKEPGVPHFVFFKNGKQVGSYTGGGSLTGDQLERLFAGKAPSLFGKPAGMVTTRQVEPQKPAKKIEAAVKAPVKRVQEAARTLVKGDKRDDYSRAEKRPAKKMKSKRDKFGFKRSRSCPD